jgi:hypothetical protein
MNNDSDRGFWWGDDAHTNAQGAMSLTTNGKLCVASGIRVGYGESDTGIPAAGFAVNGLTTFNGNVAIGATTTSHNLQVSGTTKLSASRSNGSYVQRIELTGGNYGYGLYVYCASTLGNNAQFQTAATNGNVRFSNGGTTSIHCSFNRYNSSAAGHIRMTNNVLQYQVLSDARAKENIADAGDAGSKIDAIQVRQFDWIDGGLHEEFGFIAQELAPVVPLAVGGEPDDEEMMGVDASKLVPLMVKEIQSLRARVAALEE